MPKRFRIFGNRLDGEIETGISRFASCLLKRGVSRSSRTWVRDAVDAFAAADERWRQADGEVVWSRYPDADIKLATMPSASWLATVARKPGSPRRSRRKPLKPLARGMPDRSGVTAVTTLVCFLFCTRGCGRDPGARHSLRPFFSRACITRARQSRRGKVKACPSDAVIASVIEAIR